MTKNPYLPEWLFKSNLFDPICLSFSFWTGCICSGLSKFEKWLSDTWLKVLRTSRVGKAIQYSYTLLPRLARYVNDGRINIDNNLIENAIRPLAIGRKNYLFCGNDDAAIRAAIIYSLISSCKAVNVDPREWMIDVLRKLPIYKESKKNICELLPKYWEKSLNTANS